MRAEQERITEDMLKDREELMNTFGWTSSDSYSQQASSKGFQSMSQGTGEELNGHFTAIQASNEEIKNQLLAVTSGVNSLISISTDGNSILGSILTQHVLTNSYLEDMREVQKKMYAFMNGVLKTNLECIKKGVE